MLVKESLSYFCYLGNVSIKINSYEELVMCRHCAKQAPLFTLINI